MVDEPFDAIVFFGVFKSQAVVLSQTAQVVETELQPELVPQFRRNYCFHGLDQGFEPRSAVLARKDFAQHDVAGILNVFVTHHVPVEIFYTADVEAIEMFG